MKRHTNRKQSPKVVSNADTTEVLSDPHGFWVNNIDGDSAEKHHTISAQAFVGKNGRGELMYLDFFIGAGDQVVVQFVRSASLEEKEFYDANVDTFRSNIP
jgi:hypothetical protein